VKPNKLFPSLLLLKVSVVYISILYLYPQKSSYHRFWFD